MELKENPFLTVYLDGNVIASNNEPVNIECSRINPDEYEFYLKRKDKFYFRNDLCKIKMNLTNLTPDAAFILKEKYIIKFS